MSARKCACGCGHSSTTESDYNAHCRNECKCGCGGRAQYAYAPGHRPTTTCVRCGKEFAPLSGDDKRCSQCRRHVNSGGPLEIDTRLSHSRKMQRAAPEGKRWCGGCQRYRAVKFFGRNQSKYYSRCKPCARKQRHSTMLVKRYGITSDVYAAIKEEQGGKCAICQKATGRTRQLAVDHDHACCKGKEACGKCVRGLLCSNCNNMLGFVNDNPAVFRRAINYLKDPPAQKVLHGGA